MNLNEHKIDKKSCQGFFLLRYALNGIKREFFLDELHKLETIQQSKMKTLILTVFCALMLSVDSSSSKSIALSDENKDEKSSLNSDAQQQIKIEIENAIKSIFIVIEQNLMNSTKESESNEFKESTIETPWERPDDDFSGVTNDDEDQWLYPPRFGK
jgi:hypothetical protein